MPSHVGKRGCALDWLRLYGPSKTGVNALVLSPGSSPGRRRTRPVRYTPASHPKNPGIAGLDLLGLRLDRGRIILHDLDLRQRPAPRSLGDLRMGGVLRGKVAQQLLAFAREDVALQQARRIGIGRALEDAVGAHDERRAFERVDHLD